MPREGRPRIANIYGSHLGPDSTDVELELLARYDLLIGGLLAPENTKANRGARERLAARVKRLRELNPRIIVLDFSLSAPYWPRRAEAQPPEEAYLHATSGERVRGWPGYDMLNFSNPGTPEFLAERVPPRLEGLGLDGAFVDCMFDHFDAWTVEIETRKRVAIDADGDGKEDGRTALDAAWRSGKRRLMELLRSSLGSGVVLMVNAQRAGDYVRDLVNGNYLEDYVDYLSTVNWDWNEVRELYQLWCHGPTPNVTTINSTSLYWPEYDAPARLPVDECCAVLDSGYGELRNMRFGLGMALMGDGYFGFDLNTRWRGQHWWYAEFDAPLGESRGEAGSWEQGTWRREFRNGFVVANPQARRAAVGFERPYRDYTTGWAGREQVIPARDARIYFPVGSGFGR